MDSEPRQHLSKPPPLPELGWKVEELWDSSNDIHHRDPEPDRTHQLWWARPRRPSLILGSTQSEELIDLAALEADGVEVARRRSGGGIVYLDPQTDCWIDAIVPANSPLWDDDVGRAFHWLGQVWAEVLDESLPESDFAVRTDTATPIRPASPTRHRTRPFWCFSEVGHGEVTLEGFKVVGLSQRRTRHWIRLQGLVLGRWPAATLGRYVSKPQDGEPRETDQRFVNRDPFDVKAGPPPGQTFPDPEALSRRFLRRFS